MKKDISIISECANDKSFSYSILYTILEEFPIFIIKLSKVFVIRSKQILFSELRFIEELCYRVSSMVDSMCSSRNCCSFFLKSSIFPLVSVLFKIRSSSQRFTALRWTRRDFFPFVSNFFTKKDPLFSEFSKYFKNHWLETWTSSSARLADSFSLL